MGLRTTSGSHLVAEARTLVAVPLGHAVDDARVTIIAVSLDANTWRWAGTAFMTEPINTYRVIVELGDPLGRLCLRVDLSLRLGRLPTAQDYEPRKQESLDEAGRLDEVVGHHSVKRGYPMEVPSGKEDGTSGPGIVPCKRRGTLEEVDWVRVGRGFWVGWFTFAEGKRRAGRFQVARSYPQNTQEL